MKLTRFALAAVALLICAPVFSQIKPCDELKSEIETKLKDHGVVNYTLEIVLTADAKTDVEGQKIVGSCNGGKNKIIYTRGSKASEVAEPKKVTEEKKVTEPKKTGEPKKIAEPKKTTEEKK
jgi:hypothetical protein